MQYRFYYVHIQAGMYMQIMFFLVDFILSDESCCLRRDFTTAHGASNTNLLRAVFTDAHMSTWQYYDL